MALQAGQGGGDYMTRQEWLDLGRESALVALVLNGWTTTTTKEQKVLDTAKIDVYVLTGARKGEVMRGEQVIGKGLVTPLEKVKTGDETAYVIGVGKNGDTQYAQANAPGDALTQAAIDLFESLKAGDAPTAETKPAKTNGTKAASKSKAADEEKVPAGVGASGGYDDDPDF